MAQHLCSDAQPLWEQLDSTSLASVRSGGSAKMEMGMWLGWVRVIPCVQSNSEMLRRVMEQEKNALPPWQET